MTHLKNPFRVVGNEVQELIGGKYVTVASCLAPPKITHFAFDGTLYVGKISKGHLNAFYYDGARQRIVKAQNIKKMCPEGVGEICYVDLSGNIQRLVKLMNTEVGAEVEREFFPTT